MAETEDDAAGNDEFEYGYERRRYERRSGFERRGALRWDPRALEKERRTGNDRRKTGGAYMRQ